MKILVTYDVNTSTIQGEKRLRAVAKICKNHGIRVQNSVFECIIDHAQLTFLESMLEQVIDVKQDSIRIYKLPSRGDGGAKVLGKKSEFTADSTIII